MLRIVVTLGEYEQDQTAHLTLDAAYRALKPDDGERLRPEDHSEHGSGSETHREWMEFDEFDDRAFLTVHEKRRFHVPRLEILTGHQAHRVRESLRQAEFLNQRLHAEGLSGNVRVFDSTSSVP